MNSKSNGEKFGHEAKIEKIQVENLCKATTVLCVCTVRVTAESVPHEFKLVTVHCSTKVYLASTLASIQKRNAVRNEKKKKANRIIEAISVSISTTLTSSSSSSLDIYWEIVSAQIQPVCSAHSIQ